MHTQGENNFYHFFIPLFLWGKPQVSVTLPGRLEAWGNHRSPWHYLEDSKHGETPGLRDITWKTRSMGKPQVSVTLPGRLGAWGNHRSPWHYLEDSEHGELLHHDHLLLRCVREVVVFLRHRVEHLGHVQQLDRVDRRLDQLHLVIQAQRLEPCTTNNKAWTLHNKLQN